MAGSTKRPEHRLDIRLPATARKVLKRAALSQHKSLRAFVLESALVAATEALAARHEFKLSARQYDDFVAALDAPLRAKPRLVKLLKTPSAFE